MSVYGSKELARSFRTVRGNTLDVARDIPEDQYGFSPAPGCRTVEKVLTHIALACRFQYRIHAEEKRDTLDGFDFPALMGELGAIEAVARTKSEVIAFLEKEGEVWASFLDGLSDDFLAEHLSFPGDADPPSKSRLEMVMSVKEHEMHHRGQLMITQRMLGIVPHLTRRREEMMARRG